MSRSGPTQSGFHEEETNTHISSRRSMLFSLPPSFLPFLPPSPFVNPLTFLSWSTLVRPQGNSVGASVGTADSMLKAAFTLEGPRPPGCRGQKCIILHRRGGDAEESKCGEGGTDGKVIGRCSKFQVPAIPGAPHRLLQPF